MSNESLVRAAALVGLSCLFSCSSSDRVREVAPSPPGALRVLVTDSRTASAVPGATVRIGDQAKTTDPSGSCDFTSVPAGHVGISLTRAGYRTAWLDEAIPAGQLLERRYTIDAATDGTRYDVVVVGAGTGGVAAAVQAARMGAQVALVEESDWIGGQMTAAAVTSLDEGANIPDLRSGIYKAFVDKVLSHYRALNKSTGTAYFNPRMIAFEPSVGQRMLYELLRETDSSRGDGRTVLDVYLSTKVAGVQRSGSGITGLTLGDGSALQTGVVIDATEFGDVMPLAGARYRVGTSTSDAVQSTACTQFITYTAVMRRYPEAPRADLVMQSPPPGYSEVGPKFAQLVTNDGKYASVLPVNFVYHNAWRGMPDSASPFDYDASLARMPFISRTGVNWFNDWAVTVRYVEDRAYRASVDCQAKLRTLQLMYYFQHDLKHGDWSVADDEGFDTAFNLGPNSCPEIPEALKPLEHLLPVKPYVREARRGIGMKTLRAADIRRQGAPPMPVRRFASALAVGDYPVDLHGCNAAADLDCGETLADIPPWGGGPFQVPFEVFVPETVDGLLFAEKNLSMSRLANGATRLQPITMMTGQAAGALAALAAQRGIPPRQIRPLDVQVALLDAGCVLSVFNPPDVPATHPYWKALQLALVHEIIGYAGSKFGVDDAIRAGDAAYVVQNAFGIAPVVSDLDALATRGEFAQMLADAMRLDLTRVPATPFFWDVPSDRPEFGAVQALEGLGVFGDLGAGFEPDRLLTRGESAYFVVNAGLATRAPGLDVAARAESLP